MISSIENGKILIKGKLEARTIVIEDGKIKAVKKTGGEGEIIDASGKIIIPGLIDCHVHLREPGMTQKEDITSGTSAAAAGGVTTVLEMPNTNPPTTTLQLLKEKRELMKEKSIVNFGLYMGATADNSEEIKNAENIAGVKLYMGSSTGNLLVTDENSIKKIFETGKTVVVHAEDEEIMKKNAAIYTKNDASMHSKIRSSEAETSAIKKAIKISAAAKPKRLHFTHVSSGSSVEAIKASGASCDVTPHHLFLTEEALKEKGNYAKMNPSLKSKEDVEAIWRGLNDGIVSCIATDHAGHTHEEKETDYLHAPSGVPGLETMLPLLLNAVNEGKLTLQKVIELTSENPAMIFGIKNKGKIEEGYDADLVIVDMGKEKEVKNEELFTKCGWSPFNGWKLKGWPVITVVNGNVVFENGEINNVRAWEVEFE